MSEEYRKGVKIVMCLASGRLESRHCFHATGIKRSAS